ncbi:MAG: DmsE family decaheme c-type cytochrome [Alphaproteobacteria bacterium]|nr:DmsE family decaheme c-type cytochrome [Alphaproteobacteria bacterium]MDE2630348.1 DmsE family decaheme c-type cytochrome [Alphaproteobacteria bacterium]
MSARNRIRGFAVLVLLCAMIFGTAKPAFAADPQQSAAPSAATAADEASGTLYSARGVATCMKCHDTAINGPDRTYKASTSIFQTPHATKGDARAPFAQHDCESCHGPSEAHVASHPAPGQKRALPAVVFNGPNASPVSARNEVCLSCHQNGLRMDWVGSQHQDNNLACVSCHTIHVAKDPILVKATQPEKCFGCHAEQRALTLQFSHHPVREGKVVCSDCHNPHGSAGPSLLKKVRVTDLCYGCHADKRGPMLWEHQPVREDCTNCHNPHGSVNPRLLKEKVPFLCLDCHAATNDMGGVGVSVHSNAPGSGSLYLYGDRSCLNCHSQIHGSNSPSGSTFFR